MFRNPDAHRHHLSTLSTAFIKYIPAAMELVNEWKQRDSEELLADAFANLERALERIQKIVKFMVHVWGFKCTVQTSSADVVALLNSKGDTLERSLANIANKEPAWKIACEEVLRTATTSRALEPLKQRVQETLETTRFSCSRMNALLDDFEKLRAGMRAQDLDEIVSLLGQKLMDITQAIMSKSSEEVRGLKLKQEELYTLIRGLELLRLEPGMQHQSAALKKWSTEHGQHLIKNDFLAFADESTKKGLADMQSLESILKRCGSDMQLDETVETGVAITGLAVSAVVGLVAEAGPARSAG